MNFSPTGSTIMGDPYTAPEANLIKPSSKQRPYKNGFDRSMMIAATIQIVLLVTFSTLSYFVEPSEIDVVQEVISHIFSISQIILIIYLIKRLRVSGLGSTNEVVFQALGSWGYCWRGAITILVSVAMLMVPVVLIAGLTGFSLIERVPILTLTIIYGVLFYPLILFVVWLLFSKDRSGQFRHLFSIFRGY